MSEQSVLIVGAGHAAGEFAFQLRMAGHAGPITLVGEEPHLPYQRPPLSKAFLSGDAALDNLLLKAPAAYQKADIGFLGGVRVTAIDRAQKAVRLEDGRALDYGTLVLATGGRPRLLQLPGHERFNLAPNLHYLRTIGHVERLRGQFQPGARLVIVGGGYVGLEVAAVARKRGLEVTVLEAQPRVLARVTAPEVSAFYERVHREAGVTVLTATELRGFELDAAGQVTHVLAGDGMRIPADVVIVGIGLIPNVELAEQAGLAVDNGIVVDEYGRTEDPAILAIGDCTSHPNAYAGRRLRLESVPSALEQARSAAALLTGKLRPYDAVPWFWSDQYDLKLQMVGLNQGYDQVVFRGAPEGRSFVVFYLRDGRVIAADAVSRPGEFALVKRLVAEAAEVPAARLADETQPLKDLLAAKAA